MDKVLRKLSPSDKTFTANGTTYHIESSISQSRWVEYQKLQVEIGYSITFEDLFNKLREAYDAANAQRLADVCVILYNIMHGVKKVAEADTDNIIRMCALFINYEGEDRRFITEADIEKKAKDWQQEGIDMSSFFQLAVHSIRGFAEIYSASTKDTLSV